MNWAHSSARQLRQVLFGSDGRNMHLPTCADEVLGECEICRASDKAPHDPAAGNSAAAMLNEKLRAYLSFLDDVIAARAMDVFSKNPPSIPIQTKHP